MEHQLIAQLKNILEPVGQLVGADKLDALIGLVENEIGERPIVVFCENVVGTVWEVGKPSPVDEGESIVFAMLVDDRIRAVRVWYVKTQETEEKKTAITYWSDWIWEPRVTQGMCSARAVYQELVDFLLPDDEPEPEPEPEPAPKANGSARASS